MSLGARATKCGAKGKEGKHAADKGKGADRPQPKEKAKPQATTEQLRMAHMIDRKSDDSSEVRRMVLELMEMTCRTEDEVCSALHDTDNDLDAACNLLLEESQRIQGEWQTREKKKKKPPAPAGNGEVEPRDPRSRSGPRSRRGDTERPERGEGSWRGRGGGRGRGAARGARGGARGGRGRPRGAREHDYTPLDSGSSPQGEYTLGHLSIFSTQKGLDPNAGDSFPATEDWDNEEWSGSLSDTKCCGVQVFIASSSAQLAASDAAPAARSEDWDTPETPNGPTEGHIPTYTYHNPHHHNIIEQATVNAGSRQSPVAEPPEPYIHQHTHQPMGMSGSLSAAQTQYLTQLTQQSQRHDNSVYTSNYGVYGSTDISAQRKPQRARVPPPSKIPSSAVEMPGGESPGMFLDVQFGALEPDTLHDTTPTSKPPNATPEQPAPAPPAPEPADPPAAPPAQLLTETIPAVETPVAAPAEPAAAAAAAAASSLEKQLSASMKQLSVSGSEPLPAAPAPQHYAHHRPPKQAASAAGAQNVYAHHAVSHHPPVYGASVYAPPVNSTNASLTGASAMAATAYPSSVTLTQFQPIMNSYQTSSSGAVYGGSALYTAAPYTAYQPPAQPKIQPKEHQYDNSVASSNSLTSTSTTQTSTAKITTTTVGAAAGVGGAYAGGALYSGATTTPYAAYDDQLMRSTHPHHMGGYYEVGYGARDGAFGLSAGDRFGRTDAASPQQVPAAALPPGYAYFAYQPPPTTYQYGVYPTYGGGSAVGGGGKVGSYAQQQQPAYDAQDNYKPANKGRQGHGPPDGAQYTGAAGKTAGAAADLGAAMYAKTHVTLNKVNSYDKATFQSGTPPPFGASHLYIPAPPHHHHHHHQMDVRVNNNHNRRESGSGGARSSSSKPAASKPNYSQSYWAPN
ncbi:protein lingerer isoform X5 [Bombyx mori]|uniref:protein lingerer isoform X5 n=1 Tax=Bombyx mori TaxID=7091 RepID=UPI002ED32E63